MYQTGFDESHGDVEWEKLSVFHNILISKLPSSQGDDFSTGILETIDLESYHNEARESMSIGKNLIVQETSFGYGF